jgi:hypothetical protein
MPIQEDYANGTWSVFLSMVMATGAGTDARRTSIERTGETGVADARAQSRSSSALSSGMLSMLTPLADLRSADADADAALVIAARGGERRVR